MNTLLQFGRDLFHWTWMTSLQASLLILLVLFVQRLLEHWLTPRLRYALSLLVIARLLLPSAPPSHLSLQNLYANRSQPSISNRAQPQPRCRFSRRFPRSQW
jgi:beta-lactamase regulating signal transducer with metallopeptidase domain